MLASAREIAVATSLAGSYLAAAESIAANDLQVFAPVEEALAPDPFKPESLGLARAAAPFTRSISMLRLDLPGKDGGPFYQLRVEVSWPGKDGKLPVCYSSSTIISGVTP